MTPEKFLKMTYDQQTEFLEYFVTDYEVLRNMIQDRNEFREYYYILYNQLVDAGITPAVDYFKQSKKGRKNNV